MSSYSVQRGVRRLQKVVVVLLLCLLVAVIGAMIAARQYYNTNLQPVSQLTASKLITIESGASTKQVAAQLHDASMIRDATVFEWYVRINGLRENIQAGSYYLRPNMSVQEIVGILTQGKVATDLFTILPGKRLDQIRQAFIDAGYDAASVDAALNPAQYKDHPALVDKPAAASLEGYLYPESFQKTATTKPETIIKQSLDLTQRYLTPEVRAGFVRHGLTVHEGVIVASIVEQEVSGKNPNDRPMVAQVFLKRLQIGMELGSDSTAVYGAKVAGKTLTVGESIGYDSPYNTRMHTGMPPGPISNISESSLKAVAMPAQTDYVYFVSGDDGATYFSRTFEEHEANIAAHCKALCAL